MARNHKVWVADCEVIPNETVMSGDEVCIRLDVDGEIVFRGIAPGHVSVDEALILNAPGATVCSHNPMFFYFED